MVDKKNKIKTREEIINDIVARGWEPDYHFINLQNEELRFWIYYLTVYVNCVTGKFSIYSPESNIPIATEEKNDYLFNDEGKQIYNDLLKLIYI